MAKNSKRRRAMDNSTSSHVEDTREKENSCGENRQNTKAD